MLLSIQGSLPVDLFDRLQDVRNRYAVALAAAATGDYSHRSDLRAASRYVGALLAKEARKSVEERHGLRLLDISLAVDRFIPELRGWNQFDALQQQRRRLNQLHAAAVRTLGTGSSASRAS